MGDTRGSSFAQDEFLVSFIVMRFQSAVRGGIGDDAGQS